MGIVRGNFMNSDNLWSELEKYNLTQYNSDGTPKSNLAYKNQFKDNTAILSIFNMNLNRALIPYDVIVNSEEEGSIDMEYLFSCE
jgi:hypothetical protein